MVELHCRQDDVRLLTTERGPLVNTTITIIDTKSNEKIIIIVADNVNYDLENDKYNGTKRWSKYHKR